MDITHRNNQILSARLSLRIKQSMSQGRKVFKFLKFLDEVKNIEHFLRTTKKPLLLKILITLSYVSSFFYYILDNTLWAIAMGILRYFIREYFNPNSEFFEEDEYTRWKKRKHSFSLMRNILQLIINLLKVNMSKK
jgi:Peroxisomal biogenesis factor 11 (PEX11).